MSDGNNPAPVPEAATIDSPPVRKPLETWQVEKGVHEWLVAFTRTLNRWPVGRALTEPEFDAAIKAAFEIAFR